MGVSGVGKSTVGRLVAERLDVPYVEGDDFHSPANIALMRRGRSLTDVHRHGWLLRLRKAIVQWHLRNQTIVLSCSSLKRSYRNMLRVRGADVRYVFLTGPNRLIKKRLRMRKGHFMPASQLRKQLITLQPPKRAIRIFINSPAHIIAKHIADKVKYGKVY